jgi:hypothetical protein
MGALACKLGSACELGSACKLGAGALGAGAGAGGALGNIRALCATDSGAWPSASGAARPLASAALANAEAESG